MFTKILFPTDFSDLSEKSLKYVIQLKEAGTKEVLVIHVIDKWILEKFSIDFTSNVNELVEKATGSAEASLKSVRQTLGSYGFKVETRIVAGVPFREILKAESEENISAIVIGSHGLRNFEGALLGSVSEKVIRKSRKPIILIKE